MRDKNPKPASDREQSQQECKHSIWTSRSMERNKMNIEISLTLYTFP